MLRMGRGVFGLMYVALVAVVAALAPAFAPNDPLQQDVRHLLDWPSADQLIGTDDLGRDVLSRLMYDARPALAVGVIA